MARSALLLASALLMLLMPVTAIAGPTRADEGFPANHLIQDTEPSMDEQWDLDAAQATNGKYYAVWTDMRLGFTDIRFSNSSDGSVWGDGKYNGNDAIVNDDSGSGAEHYHPSIAVTDDMVLYVVWVVDDGATTSLRMSRSTSQGNTWNRSWAIETNGTVSDPYLRWCDSGLVLCYTLERSASDGGFHKDIMFARSIDGGVTFSEPVVLNDDGGEQDQIGPRMATSGDRVAVVWEDYRDGDYSSGSNPDIYLCHSKDGGLTFSGNIKADEDGMMDPQMNPDIAFNPGGDLIVVFQEGRSEGWRISYSMAWTSSEVWDEDVLESHLAVVTSNLSRADQTFPRASYVDGAFVLAWTETDTKAFILIRAGYVTRDGEPVLGDHIVDDTITLGEFSKTPGVYYAQMERSTSGVIGRNDDAQVFWVDYRTDPVPDDGIREDGDPYTARAFPIGGAPEPPETPVLRATAVTWNSVRVEWNVSGDVDFQAYFLTYGKGSAAVPDLDRFDESISDRARSYNVFTGLSPDTTYQFRLMVSDEDMLKTYSKALDVRTERNIPPRFDFIEPDGIDDECDSSYTITYLASDPEDIAYYELYYDTDQDQSGQVFLTSGYTSSGEGGEFVWNTTGLPDGGYTINATITDNVNPPRTYYSYSIIISHPKTPTEHPLVSLVIVEGGRDTAYADASIKVTFSTQVSPVSINGDSFFVLDRLNQKVSGTLSVSSGSEVVWVPRSLLSFGSNYTLTVTSSVTDLQGNLLDGMGIGSPSTYRMQMHVRPADGEPQVRYHSPEGSGIRLRPEIMVVFDIPMDRNSMDATNVTLSDGAGAKVPLLYDYDSGSLTLHLSVKWPLSISTEYTVRLSTSVRSEYARNLGGAHEWSFVTGEPDMITDSDGDGVPDDLDWFPYLPTETQDSDRDGLGNNSDPDDDNDQIPDTWEVQYGLDPLDATDAEQDKDGDGASNLEEYRDGTDPTRTEPKDDDITVFVVLFIFVVAISVAIVAYGIVKARRMKTEREMRSFYDEE